MAIDMRPTFGQTLLAGLIQKEQLNQDKERTKLMQQQQKIAQEEFQLKVQQHEFEKAQMADQARLAGIIAGELGLPGKFGGATLPELATIYAQKQAAAAELERTTEVNKANMAVASLRANTDKYIETLRDRGSERNAKLAASQNLMQLASNMAIAKSELFAKYSEIMGTEEAQKYLGTTGNVDRDMQIYSERMRAAVLGGDPNALMELEDAFLNVDRYIQAGQGANANFIEPVAKWVGENAKKIRQRGVAPTDEDLEAVHTYLGQYAEEKAKTLFADVPKKDREAAKDQWVDSNYHTTLMVWQDYFMDPNLGTGLDFTQPEQVEDLRKRGADARTLYDLPAWIKRVGNIVDNPMWRGTPWRGAIGNK